MNDKYLLLVNKYNVFEDDMLESFSMQKVKDLSGATFLEKETLIAFKRLKKHMNKKFCVGLTINSAGRTIEQQQKFLDDFINREGKENAEKRVAKPRASEHHTGLALDVGVYDMKVSAEQKIFNSPLLTKVYLRLVKKNKIQEEKLYKKLHNELTSFGFILRYPEDKKHDTHVEIYEPWHIRYVGVENALEMNRLNMCLEEYVEFLKNHQVSA
jgi:D-alanyl-D-alanine carboxypeptidase